MSFKRPAGVPRLDMAAGGGATATDTQTPATARRVGRTARQRGQRRIRHRRTENNGAAHATFLHEAQSERCMWMHMP